MKKQDFENTEYGCWRLKKTEFNWRLPYLPMFWIIFHHSHQPSCPMQGWFRLCSRRTWLILFTPKGIGHKLWSWHQKIVCIFTRERYTRIPNYNSIYCIIQIYLYIIYIYTQYIYIWYIYIYQIYLHIYIWWYIYMIYIWYIYIYIKFIYIYIWYIYMIHIYMIYIYDIYIYDIYIWYIYISYMIYIIYI